MPSDDELRRVAEDVRALARSLGRDIRAALDRAREDMYGPPRNAGSGRPGRWTAREELRSAARTARHELRQAQMAVRHSGRTSAKPGVRDGGDGGDLEGRDGEERAERVYYRPVHRGAGPGCPPRWDDWGRRRYRDPVGARPRNRGSSGGPNWPPPPGAGFGDRAPVPLPPPAPPLRHRHDGTTLLGLLAVVFGLAWLVAGTHVAHVSTEAVVAVALMVVGAATVVTARTDWALSRRSWPLFGGAGLAVVLLALSASPSLPAGFRHLELGSRLVAPQTWADVPTAIHGGFGKTVVDLTALPTLTATRTLDVDSAAGRVEVDLPAGQKVILDAQMTAGQIDVNHVITSGVRRVDHQVLNTNAAGPPLILRVQSGFGSMAITQAGAGPPIPNAARPPKSPFSSILPAKGSG